MIKYVPAPDIKFEIEGIVKKLGMHNVKLDNVVCMRSYGSAARYTLARCWGMPRIWQLALGVSPHYIIEVISEKYDKLPDHEREKVLIHEALHIPQQFRGGLRRHDKQKLTPRLSDSHFIDQLHSIFKLRSKA